MHSLALWAATIAKQLDEQQVAQFRNALDYSFIDRAEGTTYDKETPPGIILNSLYPRVWRLYGNGDPVGNYTTEQQLECEMFLNDDGEKSRASVTRWWSLRCGAKEDDGTGDGTSTDTGNRSKKSSNNVFSPCASFGSGPEVVLVSSLVATGALASFSKLVGGVTGMYVVYVLAVGSFARSLTTNLVGKIPFHDLPNTHRLTRLTEDIYAMRRSREFVPAAVATLRIDREFGLGALALEAPARRGGASSYLRPSSSAERRSDRSARR